MTAWAPFRCEPSDWRTRVAAIFDSVPHFRGHIQEIVHIARLQLGDAYKFAWPPTTPEQGAPV